MADVVRFWVPGVPVPGGSKRAFRNQHTGRIQMVDASGDRVKGWRERVAAFAAQAWEGPPFSGPVVLAVDFVMPRPKGHYGTGRNARRVRPSAAAYPTGRPDRTKLLRALEDALTGIAWLDDAQVVGGEVCKVYGPEPGARVVVESLKSEATYGQDGTRQLIENGSESA